MHLLLIGMLVGFILYPVGRVLIKKLIENRRTYSSIYTRYVKNVDDIIHLKEVIIQRYGSNEIDDATYSTLCPEKSHIYDAGEKLPVTKRIYFEKKIKVGNRNNMIGLFGMKLIFNNPFIDPQKLLKYLYFINYKYMEEPLTENEVYNSFIYNYKRYLEGEMDFTGIIDDFKYGIFHRDADQDRSDVNVRKAKQRLGQEVYYTNKQKEQIENILNSINQLKEKKEKVTQKKISDLTGIKSLKTIRKYLNIIEGKNG